ncbi:hypothetical protein [[Arthrobacter] sp. ATCC 21022]|uniref:hypothetical protein n=1 Tax=[Arthrobacter] sp. ATCC 21022 TaxID=1771959 RepID=UPI00074D3065|nr:hypothetical protein AUT26_08285 [Arthrobacter sp. ATCC 21022]KUR63428.1 hypothetical protein JM67_16880 [Arthrobacter sp. ATCC 21022]
MVGVLAAIIAVGLILVDIPADNAAARLIPAIVSAVSLILSAVIFLANHRTRSVRDRKSHSIVASGTRSVAAGRDAVGNAVGSGASTTTKRAGGKAVPGTVPSQLDVTASGKDAVAAGRDATDNATGDSSTAS